MANNPFISWQEWEEHVLDFFRFALTELAKQQNLPHFEAHKINDNLNRNLYLVCRKNVVKWTSEGSRPLLSFVFGGRNQPREEDNLPHESENKEPDLQVGTYSDPVRSVQFSYTVECKRLYLAKDGSPHGSCQYYLNDGVLRFIKRKFSYGIDVESGLMIAYFQSGDLGIMQNHINNYCTKNAVNQIVLNDKWHTNGVSELIQQLSRTEMDPVNFCLHHFWLDLRKLP